MVQKNKAVNLYFSPDTKWMRTPFRDAALNFIYKAALDLADGRLESAEVSISDEDDDEDYLSLHLMLTVDDDWEFIKKLGYDIFVKLGEWSKDWSEEEREDYGRRIYFTILPLVL